MLKTPWKITRLLSPDLSLSVTGHLVVRIGYFDRVGVVGVACKLYRWWPRIFLIQNFVG